MKHPFSLYDFLGYFIPGVVTVFIISLFVYYIDNIGYHLVVQIYKSKLEFYVLLIIISYIIGHAVNFTSSITIEKYAIWKHGYPSYFLLNDTALPYIKRWEQKDLADFLNVSKSLNLLWKIRRKLFNSKHTAIQKYSLIHYWSSFWRIMLFIVLLPISLLDIVIGFVFKLKRYYTNPLDPVLQSVVRAKLMLLLKKVGITESNLNFDFNRVVSHYYYERYNNHTFKFDNYVALYGFTRALSLIFSTAFWLFVILLFYKSEKIQQLELYIGFLFLFLSYIFFMAFMKFYRRYTLEGFMCLVVDNELINATSN